MAAPTNMTPEERHERAKKAAAARHSVDTTIKQLVEAAPELTAEQIEKLRSLLPMESGQ